MTSPSVTLPARTAPTRRRSPGLVVLVGVGLALGLLSSCAHHDYTNDTRTRLSLAENQLLHGDYRGALATFESLEATDAAEASNSKKSRKSRAGSRVTRTVSPSRQKSIRSRVQLGMGRCYMELGLFRKALQVLKQARVDASGRPDPAVERVIGEVYFRNGDYALAYRHLEPLTSKFRGSEHDRLLMRLAICQAKRGNGGLSQYYWRAIQNRSNPELQELEKRHLGKSRQLANATRPPKVRRKSSRRPSPPRISGPVAIRSRSIWNARPIRSNINRMSRIHKITVHHTGDKYHSAGSASTSAHEIKAIQKYHQQQNGWADIGYHYIVDPNGRVWEGRPIRYQGAHARGRHNVGNIGVVLLGNFLIQKPSRRQLDALEQLVVQLCREYRVPRHQVHTHSELLNGETKCPGPVVSRWIERFRRGGRGLAYKAGK